jgi:hypothetical protein
MKILIATPFLWYVPCFMGKVIVRYKRSDKTDGYSCATNVSNITGSLLKGPFDGSEDDSVLLG